MEAAETEKPQLGSGSQQPDLPDYKRVSNTLYSPLSDLSLQTLKSSVPFMNHELS